MDMLKEVFRLFGRQTTQRLVGEIIQNKPQFARAAHMFPQIMSIDDTMRELNAHDLATNQRELTAAWTGLMETMGSAGVPVAIMALHGVTAGIHMLTDAAVAHPDAAAGLLAVAGALSALLAVGGALGVAAFALRGFGSALGLFRVGAPAALGLETLGAGGRLLAFATGVGAVAAAVAAASYVFRNWSDLNQKEATTTGLANPHALPTIGSHAMPDHGLPRVLPRGLMFGAMPPPPANAAANDTPIVLQGDVHLDGRKVGTVVAKGMATEATRPTAGPTQPSVRATQWLPSLVPALQ